MNNCSPCGECGCGCNEGRNGCDSTFLILILLFCCGGCGGGFGGGCGRGNGLDCTALILILLCSGCLNCRC